jgi:hypothetical protein
MSKIIQLWVAIFVFFLTHQTEEVFYSIGEWHTAHQEPSWTKFVNRSLMVKMDTWIKRALFVVTQCIGLLVVALLVNESLFATQIVVTIFLSIMMAAFILHITLSIATRSAMPGLSTSVFPGLPVGLLLFYLTWQM